MKTSADGTAGERRQIAEAIRAACAAAAARAYEEAGISGLCAEGRWEVAIEAIRHLDVEAVLREAGG